VLIVEDESITALELKRKLMHWGYEISGTADTGKTAVEMALKLEPDLILMDIILKDDMDGIKSFKEIKKSLDIPIIYITAHVDEKTLNRAQNTSPYGYILKPFDDNELKFTIEMALLKHGAETRLRKLNQSLRVLSDCNQAIIRADTEKNLLIKLCEIIVTEGNCQLAVINFVDRKNTDKIITKAKYPDKIDIFNEKDEISLYDSEYNNHPVIFTIKNRTTFICNNITKESSDHLWVSEAVKNGYMSLISIPLVLEDEDVGCLSIYSSQKNKFDPEEVKLFDELASDISYGINVIRNRLIRERMEKELKKSKEKYKSLYTAINEGMALHEIIYNEKGEPVDYEIIDVNPAYEKILNLKKEDIVGKLASEIFENKKPPYIDIYAEVAKNGNPVTFETYYPPFDKYFDISVFSPGLNKFVTVFEDITTRKNVEKIIKESERRLNSVLQGTPIPTFVIDQKHRVIYWNQALEKYTNVKAEDIVGTTNQWKAFYDKKRPVMADLLVDNDIQGLERWYNNKYSRSKFAEDAYESIDFFPRLNKEGIWLYFTAAPIKDEDGNVIGAVETLEDITLQKNAEIALKESEERYKRLLKQSFDAVLIHRQGKIISINDAGARILGAEKKEIVGKSLFKFIHPDYHDIVKERIEKVYKNRVNVPLIEQKFLKADGTPIDVEVVGTGFIYDGKKAVQSVFRDITQRKEYENQIINSLKQKNILLKEIHHRVKNNMQIISSLLNLQSEYCEDGVCELFNETKNRVKSMAIVHEKLYQSEDFSGINFRDYIQSLTSEVLASYLVDTNIIKLKIDVDDIKLNLNTAIPLGLIINELLTNCIKHAFPDSMPGLIEIKLHKTHNEYELVIKDDGIGFSKDFDLKNVKTLGMELVKSLARQLEAILSLEKEPKTVFRLKFKELKNDLIIKENY